ncbi:beta-ketoacyl synthase N-terminal-like domain-containing protein [Salarchaeum sp. JOR-1]|uniref:thiolase C-terminal domain-containing protein n=1 Tax=Salarchaeum sp. JOR-1 TaxID=2599399 RepID=UPI0011986610|nr:beta-ketoacyl synthase N-terminal-like domain-containing protein [Salarchaeum sp. JOR-1]QDX40942.1 3-ketoacyl-CoA thiolase [Salarchaeum sp. JOR-1]
MRDVAVVGAGMIDFGELFEQSFDDMAERAYLNALDDVDKEISSDDIDAAWFGTLDIAENASSGLGLSHPTGLFEMPVTRVENACATGSTAFRSAVEAVRAGSADVALVLGAEKMRDSAGGLIEGASLEQVWRGRGVTMPAFFGLRATRHMEAYGTTREQVAEVSVKNHENGAKYPHAHYRFTCSVEDVVDSPQVTYPLNLYDCCPVTDGAAATVIVSEDVVDEYTDDPVWVAGSGLATDTFQRGKDESLAGFPATRQAAEQAYEEAGITADDVDVAEVHDCFTITELVTYEDLGFCETGEGGAFVESGTPHLDGEKPVNPSGGLLAKGHPIGATGVAQVNEIYEQLRGEAGAVQVENDPEYGLQHNIGIGRDATGSVSCINVLSKHRP